MLTPASRQSTLGMLTWSLPSTGKLTTSVLHLNQMQMNTLIAHGVHPIPPHNGPSDGEPIYELLATTTTLELLATQPEPNHWPDADDDLIDPQLQPPPQRSSWKHSKK
jgi:hypothetical protein